MPDANKTLELILRARNQLDAGLGAGRRSVRTFADGTIGHFKRITGAVLNLQNMLAAGIAGLAARAVFKPALEMQDFITQYRNLTGSVEAAHAKVAELMEFSDVTPFEPEPVVKTGMMLDRFTRGAVDTLEIVRLVGDAAAGTGARFDELGMWVGRAYAMIQGGEPIGEATRRLMELGVVTPDVKSKIEALQKQNRSAAEVWAVLRTALEQHTGAMERLSQTTSGRLSTLRGKWTALRRDIGEGAIPALDRAVEDLIATIDELRESGKLAEWGEEAAETLTKLWEAVTGLANFVKQHHETLATLGMTYAGYRIIRSATTAIVEMRMATVALGGSAAATAGSLGLLQSALVGVLSVGIQAGLAGIAVLLWKIHEAADASADAIDRIHLPGSAGAGASGIFAPGHMRKGWRGVLQALGDYFIAPYQLKGSRQVGDTGNITDADLDAARRARDARIAAARGDMPTAPPPDTGFLAPADLADLDAAQQKYADERRRLAERRDAILQQIAQWEADQARERQHQVAQAEIDAIEDEVARIEAEVARLDAAVNAAADRADNLRRRAADLLAGILAPGVPGAAQGRPGDDDQAAAAAKAQQKLDRDIADARRKAADPMIRLNARDRKLIDFDDARKAADKAAADQKQLAAQQADQERDAQHAREHQAALEAAQQWQRDQEELARHREEMTKIDALIAALENNAGARPGPPPLPGTPYTPGAYIPAPAVAAPAPAGPAAAGKWHTEVLAAVQSIDRKIAAEVFLE